MSQTGKAPGVFNLSEEIKIRSDLTREFDAFLSGLKGGLSAETDADLNALALLLCETIEARKHIEREEKALKAELRRHIKGGVLALPGAIAIIDEITRTDLDKEAIERDLGTEFFTKYGKQTTYERMTVKRRAE